MPLVFAIESAAAAIIALILLAVKIFAFINSLLHSDEAYRAAGKASKLAWAGGLAVGVLVQIVLREVLLLNLAFAVAAFVFLADVRPALVGLRRR